MYKIFVNTLLEKYSNNNELNERESNCAEYLTCEENELEGKMKDIYNELCQTQPPKSCKITFSEENYKTTTFEYGKENVYHSKSYKILSEYREQNMTETIKIYTLEVSPNEHYEGINDFLQEMWREQIH